MAELKPCPFCGHPPLLICTKYRHGEELYMVKCVNCGTDGVGGCYIVPQTYEHTSEESAIYAWNKRAKESEAE